ncbi:MAG: PilZ domain-containing protein [Phycisphaerales bacterium]
MNGIPNEDVVRLINRAMNSDKPDGRSRGRMRCNNVESSLGPVLDFSATGMRVLSKREVPQDPETTMLVTVTSAFDPVTIPVKVRWSRKIGFRRHEVGIEFVEVDEQLRTVLREIARSVPADSFCMIHSMNRKAS